MDVNKKETLWNKYFICIFSYSFLAQLTMQITNYVLPLYVVNALHSKATMSGVLSAVFAVGSMLCRFMTGGLTDKYGRRKMMLLGAAIVTISLFVFGFTSSLTLILIMKFVQGVGHSINSTASNSAASDVLPKSRLGEGIGYYGLSGTIVGAFGPSLCLALMSIAIPANYDHNYSLPLIAGGFGGTIAIAIAFFTNYEKKWGVSFKSEKKAKFSIHDYIEVRSLMPALLQLFQSICVGAGMFLVLYATELGLFPIMSIYYIVSTGITLLVRFTIGRYSDRLKPKYVIAIPVMLQVCAYLLLAFFPGIPALIVSAVVSGIFSAMIQPTLNALSLKMAPASRAGAASATYWLGFDCGMAIGPTVFGIVVDTAGYFQSFVVGAGCMALFVIVALITLKKTPPMNQIVQPSEKY